MITQKEHAGGEPEYGFDVDDWMEESFAVPITYQKLSIDTIDDIARETLARRGSIKPLIVQAVREMVMSETARLLGRALVMVLESRRPKLFVHQILWSTSLVEESLPELAKQYGISKQAFDQGAHRIMEKLGLRPNRNMRDEVAREKMSKRNQRQVKL